MSLETETQKDESKLRGNKILEVIMAYARLDFSQKTTIGNEGDVLDAIGAGVNMLGEELRSSTLSLREKEQLLREIHHRVKNNLQIISSLLNLQTESTHDENFLALIRESRNRIKSMALVHEMLYATKDLSSIKLKEYITTLYESIYTSYKMPDMKIDFHLEVSDAVYFEIDRMILLGLILNEIISNSLKYAFEKRDGNIYISLHETENNYTLLIKDDGKGLPADFNETTDSNLGMQLIYLLTEQLGGQVELAKKNGTSYTLNFSK
jgi:two-component sensor histidine kinase